MENALRLPRTTPPDAVQKKLTAAHIIPNLDVILQDLSGLRLAIDFAANESFFNKYGFPLTNRITLQFDSYKGFYNKNLQDKVNSQLKHQKKESFESYPIGLCSEITRIAYHFIMDSENAVNTEGLHQLRKFISEGGIFQIIWGNVRYLYFQTAFQAGSYYFDISNDTVDLEKPKLDHAELEKSDFHDIDSYKIYALIKTNYHDVDIYANTCFPNMLPYFPLFTYSKPRELFAFDLSTYMAKLSIQRNFAPVFDAINDGVFKKSLPMKNLGRIAKPLNQIHSKTEYKEFLRFEPITKNRIERLLKTYSALSIHSNIEKVKVAGRMGEFLNLVWKKSEMYNEVGLP